MTLRVLTGTHYFESHQGGVEIVAGQLARNLAALPGIEVAWMASDCDAPPPAFPGDIVALRCTNITERHFGFPLPLPLPGAIAAIKDLVHQSDVLLLHDALYPTNRLAARIAAKLHKPVVIVQHGGVVPYVNPILRAAMSFANREIAAPCLARADQVVFVSELTANYFQLLTSFRQAPVVIFNGLRTDFIDIANDLDRMTARASMGIDPDRFTILFVGRFVEQKGLEIIRRLATMESDMQWVLCGWGAIRPEDWNAPDVHVFRRLEGHRLMQAYRAADLLILPSFGEGLPLVIQEALAMGTRVLASDELIDADPWLHGKISTAAVDRGNPERTALAWRHAIESNRCSGSTYENFMSETRRRYAWPKAADRYANLLEKLVGTAGQEPSN